MYQDPGRTTDYRWLHALNALLLLAFSREGQRYAMLPMRGFMFGMATWLLTLMLYVQYELQRVAVAAQAGDPATSRVVFVTLLMTAALGLLVLRLYRSVGRRITEWEQRDPGHPGI
jgi:hypothetical protein